MNASDLAVVGYLSLDAITCPAGEFQNVPGGAAYYAAAAAAAAGARVLLVARVGCDFPPEALEALSALGVCLDELVRDEGPSRRSRLHDPSGRDRVLPHHDEAAWWQATSRLAPPLPRRDIPARLFTAMPANVLAAQLDAAGGCAIRIADTSAGYARREPEALVARLARLTCFAPSREESRLLLPGLDDDAALLELSRRVPLVLQKRGSEGVLLRHADTLLFEPAQAANVLDTTGAGDSLVGAVAAGLAQGLGHAALLELGVRVAARTVARVGAAGLTGLAVPGGCATDCIKKTTTSEGSP